MKLCNNEKTVKLLSILCVIALFTVFSGASTSPEGQSYVNDYADILSDEAEQKMISAGENLCNETTAQVVVLTIDSLDGEDISQYSVQVFRDWEIGDEDKDNGVLIVFSLEDREMWITTGYGIEGTLTDVRLGQIRDTYAIPYYNNDEFEEGTLQLYLAIVNYIRTEEYGLEPLDGYENMQTDMQQESSPSAVAYLVVLSPVLLLAVSFIGQELKYARLLKYDKKHGTRLAYEYKKKNMGIKNILLYMLIRGSFRGGHGGFGSHGGSGGFRGGGGSTGGGGAGGKF